MNQPKVIINILALIGIVAFFAIKINSKKPQNPLIQPQNSVQLQSHTPAEIQTQEKAHIQNYSHQSTPLTPSLTSSTARPTTTSNTVPITPPSTLPSPVPPLEIAKTPKELLDQYQSLKNKEPKIALLQKTQLMYGLSSAVAKSPELKESALKIIQTEYKDAPTLAATQSANIYSATGDINAAKETLNQARTSNSPKNLHDWGAIANTYEQIGDKTAALECYQKQKEALDQPLEKNKTIPAPLKSQLSQVIEQKINALK